MPMTVFDSRPRLPSIMTTRQPVEEYWEEYAAAGPLGPDLDEVLPPLDALLIHLLVDLHAGRFVLVDLAAQATRGASTVVALNHPAPRRVLAGLRPGPDGDEVAAALRQYVGGHRATAVPLEFLAGADVPADLPPRHGVVVLADARAEDPDGLAEAVGRWFDTRPDALVLLLGVGPVNESGAVEALLRACRPETGRRLWLARESAEALASSSLAVIARRDHPHAASDVARLAALYTGNVRYLDLLWAMNREAIRGTGSDADTLRSHPTGSPVLNELNEWKGKAQSAGEELARLRQNVSEARQATGLVEGQLAAAREEAAALRGDRDRTEQQLAADRAQAARIQAHAEALWGAVVERDRLLGLMQRSLAYRFALRVRRGRSWLAPDASRRYRLLCRVRRVFQIWRGQGLWSVLKRVAGKRR